MRARRPQSLLIALGTTGLLLLLVIFALLKEYPRGDTMPGIPARVGSGAQAPGGVVASVQTTKPQRRDLAHTLNLPGNISPWYQVTLYAKVPGYLKWIGFDKGDRVKKGQMLAVIDAPEVEQQYLQAEADYKIKQITYERLYGVWKENPDVIAKQDVDVAEAAAQAARHLRDNRRTLLEYTKVIAPFDGVITARFADPGALIQAATGTATQAVPLFTMMDINTVRVYVNVPQENALMARSNTPVTLTVRELPGKKFEGSITRTTQALDPATRTLLVEVDLPNEDHLLQPGMFISARLHLKQHPRALAIPPAAIVTANAGAGKAVFVISQGKARLVPIKTGLDDGLWVEVTDGLTGDEEIVVVGKANLSDGQAVTTSEYSLPSGKPASQDY